MFVLKKPSKLTRKVNADAKSVKTRSDNAKFAVTYLSNTYSDCYFGSDAFLMD